jgi:hypothetical protein
MAYYTKTQKKAERNYCVAWYKLLAIMKTLEHFKEFHLCIDHSA